MDIVFVLDSSGSVEDSFDLSLRLTRLIVEGLNFAGTRTRVGLLTYSNTPRIRINLNQYSDKQSILNAIAFTQVGLPQLTHFSLDKMVAISQMGIFWCISWTKNVVFWLKFHWSLFPRV